MNVSSPKAINGKESVVVRERASAGMGKEPDSKMPERKKSIHGRDELNKVSGGARNNSENNRNYSKEGRPRSKLKRGYTINTKTEKYRIKGILGSGGFGDVYRVTQVSSDKDFALKTEAVDVSNPDQLRLRVELTILNDCTQVKDAERKKHFVPLVDFGAAGIVNFIVMGIVSVSLEEIRKKVLKENYTPSTAMQCCHQTLQAIWDLHAVGYVHRDIKPSNFAVGLEDKQDLIYMLDFGIGRRCTDIPGGTKARKARKYVKFIGTIRYASRNCHNNKEQSRKDDLEGWLYMALELFDEMGLPWRQTNMKNNAQTMKQKFFDLTLPQVFKIFPQDFKRVIQYVDKLAYEDQPDYKHIKTELDTIAKDSQIDMTLPLDWIGKLTAEVLLELKNKREEKTAKQQEEEEQKELEEKKVEEEEEEEEEEEDQPFPTKKKGATSKGARKNASKGSEQKTKVPGKIVVAFGRKKPSVVKAPAIAKKPSNKDIPPAEGSKTAIPKKA